MAVVVDSLSCGLVCAKGDLVGGLSRSLWVLRLLGDQSNTSLVALSWDNSNGLSIISALSYARSLCCSKAYLVVDESSILHPKSA